MVISRAHFKTLVAQSVITKTDKGYWIHPELFNDGRGGVHCGHERLTVTHEGDVVELVADIARMDKVIGTGRLEVGNEYDIARSKKRGKRR